jgi:hypothetical protein
VWGCVFDNQGCEPKGQEFVRCVNETNVTWLMDSGMFGEKGKPSAERVKNAKAKAGRVGYEFFISKATVTSNGVKTSVSVTIENRGVAPFYYDWPVEVAILDSDLAVKHSTKSEWNLPSILPNDNVERSAFLDAKLQEDDRVAIRIPNPMPNGIPIRFANKTQQLDGGQWMLLK